MSTGSDPSPRSIVTPFLFLEYYLCSKDFGQSSGCFLNVKLKYISRFGPLRNVRQLHATGEAFAAVLDDGSVVTWGNPESGGDSGVVMPQLKNVRQAGRLAFSTAKQRGRGPYSQHTLTLEMLREGWPLKQAMLVLLGPRSRL